MITYPRYLFSGLGDIGGEFKQAERVIRGFLFLEIKTFLAFREQNIKILYCF